MKTKLLFFIFFMFFAKSLLATDYYLSNSGNDNNSGTSPGAPFKTIEKLNSKMSSITGGDKILFKGAKFLGAHLIYQAKTTSKFRPMAQVPNQ
ncbi:MAG: hypothetical protein HC896_17255 [Bacteroidales bacterium]|nr:hypothetical protein [Bacteroidales bacterium]